MTELSEAFTETVDFAKEQIQLRDEKIARLEASLRAADRNTFLLQEDNSKLIAQRDVLLEKAKFAAQALDEAGFHECAIIVRKGIGS